MNQSKAEWQRRLGEIIRAARTGQGLSLDDLARAIEVSPSAVSRWENGIVPVRRKHVIRLCRVLCEEIERQGNREEFLALLKSLGIQLSDSEIPPSGQDAAQADGDRFWRAWAELNTTEPLTLERVQTLAQNLRVATNFLRSMPVVTRCRELIEEVEQAAWAYTETESGYATCTLKGAEAFSLLHAELALAYLQALPVDRFALVIDAAAQAIGYSVHRDVSEHQERNLAAQGYLALGMASALLEDELEKHPADRKLQELHESCFNSSGLDLAVSPSPYSQILLEAAMQSDDDVVRALAWEEWSRVRHREEARVGSAAAQSSAEVETAREPHERGAPTSIPTTQ